MLEENIMGVKLNEDNFNSTLVIEADLIGLREPIKIKFQSSSRNDTSYSIEHEDSCEVGEMRLTYAAMNSVVMISSIFQCITSICGYYGIIIGDNNINVIRDLILKCIRKCESRYGNSVSNWNETEADAMLVIK